MEFFRIDKLQRDYSHEELEQIIEEHMYTGNLQETRNREEILPIFLNKLKYISSDSVFSVLQNSNIGKEIYTYIKV
ncbi:MAG: hypothetical protein IKJ01_04655 [Lachnospiraceae bacterium]|nr:hypothetical protein [Lachnospiraceae bacterium]